MRSGALSSRLHARRCSWRAPLWPMSPPSESPISERPQSFGIAPAACPFIERSSGRTDVPQLSAINSQRTNFGPQFLERTGSWSMLIFREQNVSGFSITFLAHVDARKRASSHSALWTRGYLWKLTGGSAHLTDASNASRTLLYNIRTGVWDDHLLEILRVPRQLLPAIAPSSGVVAETDPDIFGAKVPISGIAGDQQAALFGQRCVHPGMVKNTYGTGCFLLMHTGERPVHSRSKLLATVAWQKADRREFALEGSVFVAGAAVQWLRDGLGLIRSAADVEKPLLRRADNGGVYLVPAFTGLGAPHWDPLCQRCHPRTHAWHDSLELGACDARVDRISDCRCPRGHAGRFGDYSKELRVDGGATRNDLLMQFQADILGVRVVRPRQSESTALGAAFLAGLGVGFWQTEARSMRNGARSDGSSRTWKPIRDRRLLADGAKRWIVLKSGTNNPKTYRSGVMAASGAAQVQD